MSSSGATGDGPDPGVSLRCTGSGGRGVVLAVGVGEAEGDPEVAEVLDILGEAVEGKAGEHAPQGEIGGTASGAPEEEGYEEDLEAWAGRHGVAIKDTNVKLLSFYWQLIVENGPCIEDDFSKNPLRGAAPESALYKGVDLINEEDILIGESVEVRSGTEVIVPHREPPRPDFVAESHLSNVRSARFVLGVPHEAYGLSPAGLGIARPVAQDESREVELHLFALPLGAAALTAGVLRALRTLAVLRAL